MDINRQFCNHLLKLVQNDLTGRELADFRKNAGVLETSVGHNKSWLVEWPHMGSDGRMFHWEGEADNRADAKAKALNYWLEHDAPAVRERVQTTGKLYPTEGK